MDRGSFIDRKESVVGVFFRVSTDETRRLQVIETEELEFLTVQSAEIRVLPLKGLRQVLQSDVPGWFGL